MAAIKITGGVLPPPPSPYTERETLDMDALVAHCDRLIREGVDGFYLCGGTGDAEKLLPDERRAIAEGILPLLKSAGKTGIVHVGQCNLRTAVAMAEHAGKHGAQGIASMPPRGSWTGALTYYRTLAEVGLPVLVYHIPGVTGIQTTYDDMAAVLDIPGVEGAKISDWNTFLLRQVKRAYPQKAFFTGFDEMLLPGLLAGADGAIGTWGNLFPCLYGKAVKLASRQRWTEAQALCAGLTDFLAEGWRYGILPVFEALMLRRWQRRCFRAPDYGDPKAVPGALLLRLEADIERLEAQAHKVQVND